MYYPTKLLLEDGGQGGGAGGGGEVGCWGKGPECFRNPKSRMGQVVDPPSN